MVMDIKTLFVKYITLRNKLNKSKIYKIIDNTNNDVYIGSTCCSLKQRLSNHKSDYKAYLNGLGGNTRSFGIIKNNNYKIELIEDCNIKTKQELLSRERFYIDNNECLNKNIPGRTQKEYEETKKIIRNEERTHYDIIKNKMNYFQKQYIILIGNLYNIIKENYIKTDSIKDIIPFKEIYNMFKESEFYINSTKEQKRKMNYKNFIEKINNNILFKNFLKQNNNGVYILTNLKLNKNN